MTTTNETTSLLIGSSMDASNLLLSDSINLIKSSDSKKLHLTLDTSSINVIESKAKKIILSIELLDIIGSIVKSNKSSTIHELSIFYYAKQTANLVNSCIVDTTIRRRYTYSLFFHCDEAIAVQWSNAINNAAYGYFPLPKDELGNILPKQPLKALIYVNPFSGKGTAINEWNNKIKKMLNEANVDVTLVITQYRDHAKEHVTTYDLSYIDLIATVSGDGLIFEVINGISNRLDGELILKKIPIAPLPGGSANGLAKSVTFASQSGFSVIDSVFIALKGKPRPLDLSYVQTIGNRLNTIDNSSNSPEIKSYYSFLMLGWGLIGDVDILSESLRFLGELRLHLAGAYYIINQHFYKGRLAMYLASGIQQPNNIIPSSTKAITELPDFSVQLTKEDGWHIIESDFLVVWVIQTSHTGSTFYSGPGVGLDDGLLTIIVAENLGRLDMLNFLLTIDTGEFAKDPKVQMYKALAYRLEPLTSKGILSLDGELVEYGPIQGIVKPSAALVNLID